MMHPALLVLLGAVLPQSPQSLLPPTPDGWRYERLDFPLSFAPELAFEGFEELRFAPGMSDADSGSYFSYALAIRLEGDIALDIAFFESFLTPYYRGLCESVGASRQLDLDLSGFSVTVKDEGRRFLATIEMVDPFLTGEPLTLFLELYVQPGPRKTELLGLASPKPQDAPIWEELHAIGSAWRAARAAPVFLNHVYVVPDAETYAAIAASEFFRETFAVSEERETVRADMSYTGLYFYGEETYFEFLKPDTSPQFGAGRSGLAFGFELEGGTDAAVAALRARGVNTFLAPITREAQGEQVPWFQIMGVESPHVESKLSLFSLEYDPQFLAEWYTDLPPQHGGSIARRHVLERYAAKLDQTELRGSSLLDDVTEVQLELDEAEREHLFTVCDAFGWERDEAADRWTTRGPGVRLVVRPSPGDGPSRGVTGFVMTLRRPVERDPIELGKILLSFEGATATVIVRP